MIKKALFLLCLTACGTQSTTGGEVLRFLSANLATGIVGESYSSEIVATAGTRPYRFSVASGQLPPGIKLEGSSFRGTPTEAGTFKFSVELSDANLSKTLREFVLEIKDAPNRTLKLLVPPTEIKGEFKVPLRLEGAKNVNAISAALLLPAEIKFVRAETGKNQPLIISRAENGVLRIDAAFIEPSKKNEDITPLTLVFQSEKPIQFSAQIGYEIRIDGKSVAKAELTKPKIAQPKTTELPKEPATDVKTAPEANQPNQEPVKQDQPVEGQK